MKTVKVGRPCKSREEKLNSKVSIRLSDTEEHCLKAHSKSEKMQITDMIRARIADLLTI